MTIKKFENFNDGGKMKDVTCKNCDWKWDIEKDDENPYLCHKCGYDNKKNKFDHKALKKWKDENPYKEEELSENLYKRTFSKETDSSELTWHRDREDRIVVPLNENTWSFQMDNELPIQMTPGKAISIKKNEFHRIIKGDDNLMIAVYKKDFD